MWGNEMPRYLQRLISGGIFLGLLTLAGKIAQKPSRSARDRATFWAITSFFIIVAILAITLALFVAAQLAADGGASVGLIVALLLLLVAGITAGVLGICLMSAYYKSQKVSDPKS